jgi:hypothetical protein
VVKSDVVPATPPKDPPWRAVPISVVLHPRVHRVMILMLESHAVLRNDKPATNYCVNQNIGTCEVGDLSGLYDNLKVSNNSGKIKATGLCPDCI